MTTTTDGYEEGLCPICWNGPYRLAVVTGTGWLTGRSWRMCFGCLGKLRAHLDAARWESRYPGDMTAGEEAACAMLRIDRQDARAQGFLLSKGMG